MLEDLAKMHNIWMAMALNIGVPYSDREDLIQEMYIRLNKYVDDQSKIYYKDTGEINRFYVWVTIRNMWISFETQKKRNPASPNFLLEDTEVADALIDFDPSDDYKQAIETLISRIDDEVDSWDYWYDQKLFNIMFRNDISMRQLSKETTISLTSIFNSMKIYKQKIRENFSEDWEDIINSNFDKL
jgi:hypothetical protein